MTALTRNALLAFRASMPKHSRGVRAIDELARMLTNEELLNERIARAFRRTDADWERVVDDAIRAEMEECREGM